MLTPRLAQSLPGLLYIYNAVLGLLVGQSVAAHLTDIEMIAPGRDLFRLWIALCSAGASVVGFHRYRGWLGRSGWSGLLRGLAGCLMMILFAALIVGTVVVPVIGTLYAPLIVLEVMASGGVPWVLLDMLLSHALMMLWRSGARAVPA